MKFGENDITSTKISGGILKFLRIVCTIIFKTYVLDSQKSKMIISATYIMVIKLVIYPLAILSYVKSPLQSVEIQYVNLCEKY